MIIFYEHVNFVIMFPKNALQLIKNYGFLVLKDKNFILLKKILPQALLSTIIEK